VSVEEQTFVRNVWESQRDSLWKDENRLTEDALLLYGWCEAIYTGWENVSEV